mmetsp:Transcript_29399/g.40616  ORF Transcript_29399/g.40616 Transcript_29399/m.40616 type:complete len:424 (-) Transcript_29399:65-1336(-)|eukprot:CAMPEP_0201488956 /NCGR_PEP_ID=MMETSP0151_2-20130828/20739_1 /ASSEMBLY_ACC=CAM_ASM_000257 /TAXON_ID=200890 /ORGANISM="Paramoeba atlantica, Strain 621/1 / CCAP 1560/9" /LENGTH=423 /DNA_ID=CAMNT_0047874403 /DNA_START=74 /DNA_END=1345 /DNA_ORIENTATION=+
MKKIISFLLFLKVVVELVEGEDNLVPPSCNVENGLEHAVVSNSKYCPYVFADGFASPRGIVVDSGSSDILFLEQSAGRISVIWTDGNSYSNSSQRAVLVQLNGLNHALAIHKNHIYASSSTDVFRWPYTSGQRTPLTDQEHVISNIPCCGHVTRTLAFDKKGDLYVQSGSSSNLDKDSSHSRIMRFNLEKPFPILWGDSELFADGLRNEVGLRFDPYNRLWGVENGVDRLKRDDIGGDIHENNPGEELNLFLEQNIGSFYGYPYCWSEFNLTTYGLGNGTQWAQEEFMPEIDDKWCRDLANVLPPKYVSQAHMAPLDILFTDDSGTNPDPMNAFVTFHGSWNRKPEAGYRIDSFQISADTNSITSQQFLAYEGPGAYSRDEWIRPVGMAMGNCNFPSSSSSCLFVTSDTTGQIIAIADSSSSS